MRVMPLALAAVCLASSQAKEPDVSDLLAADRAFYAGTHARGLDGWLAWFAPDAIVLKSDGGLMSGEAEMRAYYESLAFPPAGFTWTAEAGEIAASGDLGYTVGSWELRRPAGAPPSDKPAPSSKASKKIAPPADGNGQNESAKEKSGSSKDKSED